MTAYLVGLTGGMGAGKSTLVPIIKEAGIPVLDVDLLVKEIYKEEFFCMELDDEWGLIKGEDVKAQMAAMIIQHPDRLDRLEEIIGPWMEAGVEDFVKKNRVEGSFVVLDAPLLFESHWNDICDCVISVLCPIAIRQERVMKRAGMTLEKMTVLMSRQIDEDERESRSDYVIYNDRSVEEAHEAMRDIIETIEKRYEEL